MQKLCELPDQPSYELIYACLTFALYNQVGIRELEEGRGFCRRQARPNDASAAVHGIVINVNIRSWEQDELWAS
jgi:hypothetical protein